MNVEHALALLSLVFLGVAGAAIVRSVRSGRALAAALARRYPDTYEALGCPRPTYFPSPASSRFARFVMQREYRKLEDPVLVAGFEEHRRQELRFLAFVVAGIVILGVSVLWLKSVA